MKKFIIKDLPLEGLKLVEKFPLDDPRGSLTRVFCEDEFKKVWPMRIAQINHTWTAARGTVRGLHYQLPPHAEKKLVTCLRGEVWDIAVDLRANSPTFLRWHAEILSPRNRCSLLLPEGFAHGFQTLTDDVEMLYLHSAAHAPDSERGVSALDPALNISWPENLAFLSDRDRSHPVITKDFPGILI